MPQAQKKVSTQTKIHKIFKRDGRIVEYDMDKIINAALKALENTSTGDISDAQRVGKAVEKEILTIQKKEPNYIPHVEQIQDLVEKHLMLLDFFEAAKHFILYRRQRTELRETLRMNQLDVSLEFKEKVERSKKFFKSSLSEFVYYTAYSKWQDNLGRRETWVETVDRFMNFMIENLGDKLKEAEYKEVRDSILNLEVIPSMRLLWSAGEAARTSNVAAYNCSFVSISDLKDFSEIMYISMCGCGVGFSVEEDRVNLLPEIKVQIGKKPLKHVIPDSKEGWADALHFGLTNWFDGKDVEFDYSQIRAKGSRLKTMGGRASGPEPLRSLLNFARDLIFSKQGKRLSTIDVHDMACKVGEIVIAGGVRRSAMISLSDLHDDAMRTAKHGQFWNTSPHRIMANNSAIYHSKPEPLVFLKEWASLIESNAGERGIFNRGDIVNQIPQRRSKLLKGHIETLGTNPCGEIILRSKQFCNLTAIVVREDDNKASLLRKIRLATILGTYQASLTNFKYLSKEWKQNCEEEALLGVSFTGYYDNATCRKPAVLQEMRDEAVKVNKTYAKRFGIKESTAITCVKPSGNSSQLLNTSSGMHPRYAPYYIRRVRVSSTDPVFHMLKDQGVPYHCEVGQTPENATTYVLEFPVKSPQGAIVKDDVSAIALLEEWKKIKQNFTEHNPSATIYVGTDEWLQVANWVYENWSAIGGLTFLPRNDFVYELAPYEECDEKTYKELTEKVKNVDFSKLVYYEKSDLTTGAKELACVSGACEV